MIIEYSGKVVDCQEAADRNGVPVGRVSGLLTTFVPNRPFDSRALPARFERDAFDATIANHKERGNRPIRFLHEHMDLIGGFPIDMVVVNNDGLFATGEINLETQLGRETFSLAKQGILSDFSIGYSVTSEHTEDNQLIADSIELFEASIVEEPANQGAKVTSLESLTGRELEKILMGTGRFNRTTAKELATAILTTDIKTDEELLQDFADSLKDSEAQDAQEALASLVSDMKAFGKEVIG